MRRRTGFLGMMCAGLCCIAILLSVPAGAQAVPDFQSLLGDFQQKLDGVTVGKWSAEVWPYVVSNGAQPFVQQAPSFPGHDHLGNGIQDDHHLALFQKVLEGDACTRALLGDGFVDQVRAEFFHNRARVEQREARFTLRLRNESRIDLSYIISANNRSVWTDPANQTITTGANNSLRICVDSGIFIIGTTCLAESMDIPSLWGAEGLLNEGAPGLGEDLADLLAAYITMGNQDAVDYMQALMYQVLSRGVLGNVMELVLSMLGKGLPLEDYELAPWDLLEEMAKDDKAYNPPNIGNHEIDDQYDPPLVVAENDPYIAIRRVRATVYGVSPGAGQPGMLEGVGQHWTNWYQIGANGFTGGLPNRLPAAGDLNQDGTSNVASHVNWGADVHQFLMAENAIAPDPLVIATQPQGPTLPLTTGAYTLSLQMQHPGSVYNYTWLFGADPGNLAPISPPVNQRVLSLVNIPVGTTYYACEVSSVCGGPVVQSNTATIVHMPFSWVKQPPEQMYITVDQNEVFPDLVEAMVQDETSVTYQWYRKVSGEPDFEPYGSPSSNGVLSFTPASPADAGLYFCRATSDVYGHSIDSNQMFVFATGASLRIYDALAGLGPQGDLLVPSGSISINTNANTLQVGGGPSFFGEVDAGVSVFRFHEVNVADTVTVTVTGSRPLSITSAGDMDWYAPITVTPGTLGGGDGGAGRLGGRGGGGGGSPGNVVGSGGSGGTAGAQPGEGQAGGWGGQGNPGTDGNASGVGTAGESGLSGVAGALGYGSQGFAGAGGAAGQGGTAGTGGGGAGGGNPGHDNRGPGTAGAHRQPTVAGWNGEVGGGGGGGDDGHAGGDGGTGGDGGHASFQARSDDMTFAAGHGGGGGGGGGKGGGGRGGGAGGGGQGGGGGGGAGGITSDAGGWLCGWGGTVGYSGGGGGRGGDGGTGGAGGSALNAGDGGDGAAGGGAVIFAAKGVLRHATTTNVSASNPTSGTGGAAAQSGVSGNAGGGGAGGTAGESGNRHGYQAYGMFCGSTMRWHVGDTASNAGTRRGGHGGTGGAGGGGGDGGASGASGGGGDGGHGTPGMVKYMGSVAMTMATQIQAFNGASDSPEHSGRGTLISNMNVGAVAGNMPQVAGHALVGSLTGGDSEPVLRGLNPFTGTVTPLIGEMDTVNGHAATRGWLKDGFWNEHLLSPDFGIDTGVEVRTLTGDHSIYAGYDQVFIRNTNSSGTLENVHIRVNGGPAMPIAGTKYAAGTLAAGQTWTMSMPAGTTILAGIPPTLTPVADIAVDDGAAYSLVLEVAGSTPFSWTLVEGPDGMTVDAATGEVFWTADYYASPAEVIVRAENSVGADEAAWQITVLPVAPAIVPMDDVIVTDTVLYAPTIGVTGTTPILWTLLEGPTGATINQNTGVVNWSAELAASPAYFEVRAEGPGGEDSEWWTVTVEPASPIIDPDSVPLQDEEVVIGDDESYTISPVLLQGTPPNVWSLTAAPEGMTINETTGAILWETAYTGTPVDVGLRVENNYGQDEISWTVLVQPMPPEIWPVDDVLLWDGDEYVTYPYADGSQPMTWTLLDGPATMSIDPATGAVSWMADMDNSPVTITLRALNDAGEDTVSWTATVYPSLEITVHPQNHDAYKDQPFTLTAEWADGHGNVLQEWMRQRDGGPALSLGIELVTSNIVTLDVDPATLPVGAYQYWVRFTDGVGTRISEQALVRIADRITFAVDLEDVVVDANAPFEWAIEAHGGMGSLQYQWYKESGTEKAFTPVVDTERIQGADTEALTFDPVMPADSGLYYVAVSDDYYTEMSSTALLSVDTGVPIAGLVSLATLCALAALGSGKVLRKRK